jgi:phage terminase large subunit
MSGIQFDRESGELTYELWSAQGRAVESFYDQSVDVTDFRGGYRSGKSYLGSRAIIKGAWTQDGTKWAVVSGDGYKSSFNTTYDVLFSQFPGYDGEDVESSPIVAELNKSEGTVRLTNGSVIILSTSEKLDLKGAEIVGIWMDEAAFYHDLYDKMEMGLSRMSHDNSIGLLITTTTRGFNDYHAICEDGVNPNSGADHGWRVDTVQASVLENPFIDDSAKERLKRTHKGNEEEGLLGGFAASEGRVYPSFARNSHVVSSSEISNLSEDWRVYGMDYGWSDPTVVLSIARSDDGDLIVLDEFYASETELEEAQSWLNAREVGTVYADHHPRETERMRSSVQHTFRDADKDKDEGVMTTRQFLNHDINRSPDIYIHERCSNLIQELVGYTKDVLRGNASGDDHACDALRYALHTPPSRVFKSGGSSSVISMDDVDEDENSGEVPSPNLDSGRDFGR